MIWWAEGALSPRWEGFTASIKLILFGQCHSDRGKKQIFKYFCSLNVLIFAQRSHSSLRRWDKVKNCAHVAFDPGLEDRFLWHLMEKADLYKLPCYTVAFAQHRHLIFIMCPWWGHGNLWHTDVFLSVRQTWSRTRRCCTACGSSFESATKNTF